MKINRAGDSLNQKKRLSAFGKAMVACVVIFVIAAALLAVYANAKNTAKKEQLNNINTAIEYAMRTCATSLSSLGLSDQYEKIDALNKELDKTKDISDRTELAYEAIRYALELAGSDTKATDELNGAKNRLTIAYKNYDR